MPHTRGPSVDARTFAIPDDGDDTFSTESSDSSYAGSAQEFEMEFSPVDYLQDQLSSAFDSTVLDRAVVSQIKTSATLNAKGLEMAELLEEVNERLQGLKGLFSAGMAAAQQTRKDLEWASSRANLLDRKAKSAFPIEWEQVKEKYQGSSS